MSYVCRRGSRQTCHDLVLFGTGSGFYGWLQEPESQNSKAACLVKVLVAGKAALAAAIDADADADASGLAKEEENRTQSLEQDREEKSCKQQRMLCSLVFFNSMTFGCHHVSRPSVISIPGMLAT